MLRDLLILCFCILFHFRSCSSKFLVNKDDLSESKLPSELHRKKPWDSPKIRVFVSPTFTTHEKAIIRDGLEEFRTKTCVDFHEEEWVPWYHWKRWEVSHIIFRPSSKVNLMAESKMDDAFNRTLLYLSRESLNLKNTDLARGIVLHELSNVIGLEHENERPEAPKYLITESPFQSSSLKETNFASRSRRRQRASLDSAHWPFDPTSVTIFDPNESTKLSYRLTSLCSGVKNSEIAKGKNIGRLSFWDVVKIDSLYCPKKVPAEAFRKLGPCEGTRRARVFGVRSSPRQLRMRERLHNVIRSSQWA